MVRPQVLSLFCGPGGLDLGFRQAGFDIALAVDIDESSIRTHQRNFPSARAVVADLIALGPTGIVAELGKTVPPGSSIGVIGGPPCQGFSRANTQSNPGDPRNLLPGLYLDIVSELQKHYVVDFVLFENVLGIRDQRHRAAFNGILDQLSLLGFHEDVKEYCALDFGVPQVRRRVIISAFRTIQARDDFRPKRSTRGPRTVREAIGDFPEPAYFRHGLAADEFALHPNHWTMNPRSRRFAPGGKVRAGTRSFRQLSWDQPSPTVAYGHREIHVHPGGHRRLSVYEALVLQGFPSDFVLEGTLSAQVQQVSNAVPPPLARALANATATAIRG